MGELCAKEGLEIIYGGGEVGLMGNLADACQANEGKITGVIPQFMVDRGWCREGQDKLVVTPNMGMRKRRMRELSDGIIALPGGCGTLEEFFETVTQRQMGFYPHPVILLNVNGYYEGLTTWLKRVVNERFMHYKHAELWTEARSAEEALELFLTLPEWDNTISARSDV